MTTPVLIKNGILYSGDKNQKAARRNVLIGSDGVIQQVSDQPIDANEAQVIDAEGKWIVPGFLDTHTHYDAEVIASPGLKESARHGVTCVILGCCSVSAIYNSPVDTTDCFSRVEAIPYDVMLPLLDKRKTWSTVRGWKEYVSQLPLGINVASFIGHSDIRMKAMGIERSLSDNVIATKAEIASMCEMLNESLDEGFLGLSTMDSPWDKMDGDRYWSHKTPSFYSSWKERRPLIDILRKRDAILQGAPNLVTRISAARYMLASMGIFRKPLKTTMIAMIDLIGDRYIMPIVSLASRLTNRLGQGDFRMQTPPTPFTVYYDGVDSVMFEEFPSGQALRHLAKNIDKRNDLIRDPEYRKSFKKEIKKKFAPKVWHKDLSRSIILDCPDKTVIGKNFFQIAEEKNEHPVDVFLDMIVQYDKQIRWTTTIGNDRKEKYGELYNFPYNIISFADSGAHLNNMAFYDFPLQMIKNVYESIQHGNPIMSMEKCIWRLTKEQADWFGIERGYLAEGKVADLSILDPSKLSSVSDEVVEDVIEEFDNYPRLVNRNAGVVDKVLIRGRTIIDNDQFVDGFGKTQKFGEFLSKA